MTSVSLKDVSNTEIWWKLHNYHRNVIVTFVVRCFKTCICCSCLFEYIRVGLYPLWCLPVNQIWLPFSCCYRWYAIGHRWQRVLESLYKKSFSASKRASPNNCKYVSSYRRIRPTLHSSYSWQVRVFGRGNTMNL